MDHPFGRQAESLHLADNLGRFSTPGGQRVAFQELQVVFSYLNPGQLPEDKRRAAMKMW